MAHRTSASTACDSTGAPIPAKKERLKLSKTFQLIHRQGRWVRGRLLAIGITENALVTTRIGIRTRRGLKQATVRNTLKRRLRMILFSRRLLLRPGFDIVIVIQPISSGIHTSALEKELTTLCAKAQLLC